MLHMLLTLLLFTPAPAPAALASTSLVLPKAGDVVIALTIADSQFPAATAVDVVVDGDVMTTILIFGKVGHGPYSALLHAITTRACGTTVRQQRKTFTLPM